MQRSGLHKRCLRAWYMQFALSAIMEPVAPPSRAYEDAKAGKGRKPSRSEPVMSKQTPDSNSFHARPSGGGYTKSEIVAGEQHNRTQEEKILQLMGLRTSEQFTAETVTSYFPEIFITDARRSMTNLCRQNKIRFVEKVPGSKGVRIMSFQIITADQRHNQLSFL